MAWLTGTYLFHLVLTLTVEGPWILCGLSRRAQRQHTALVFITVNLATHGSLWSLWPSLSGGYAQRVALAETAVWLVEALLYRSLLRTAWSRTLGWTLAANAASTAAGLAVWALRV